MLQPGAAPVEEKGQKESTLEVIRFYTVVEAPL